MSQKFSTIIKKWRKANGLSLRQAGDILGFDHTTVRKWELGLAEPGSKAYLKANKRMEETNNVEN